MELTNEFDVSVPIDEAWQVLTDLERVGPCLPGASITGRDGDDFLGQAKIKVGPITTSYKGTARFIELDEGQHRAVLSAKGREARGGGDAQALVTATLSSQGDITHVSVVTDLTLSGKVAQFGRGVIADVSSALLKTFVNRLEAMLQEQPSQPAVDSPAETSVANGLGTRAQGTPSTEAAATEQPSSVPSPSRADAPAVASARPVSISSAVSAHEDDALSVVPLVRGIVIARLTKPVPVSFIVIAALLGYLIGQRRR